VQIERSASTIPWMFTPGNHEMEIGQGPLGYDGFLARIDLPLAQRGEPYYAFRRGNVGFVALDANDASYELPRINGYAGIAQDSWLDSVLDEFRRDSTIDFIVVGFHHCMYCSNAAHGSDAGPRDRWGELFDRHHVDLVINGHNHSYERTHPVRQGAATRDDTAFDAGAAEPVVIDPERDGTI
jgi:3',5'-cyclic AMP phosphodiesterase CpdA